MEVASIDEAYLDITQSQLLFQSPLHIAQSIKDQIRENEQLTCSIGVAPNKLLAKLGSGLKKPDGLVVIRKEEVEEILKDLPVSKLYGIGPKLTEAFNSIGIFTCGQLGRFPVSVLTKRFGVIGERLHEMGLGLDDSPVVPFDEEEDAKSISHSVTLEEDTSDPNTPEKSSASTFRKGLQKDEERRFLRKEDCPYRPLLRFFYLLKAEDPFQMDEQRQ